jgi:hypothetical protein
MRKYNITLEQFEELKQLEHDYGIYRAEQTACGYEVEPFCVWAGLKDNYDDQRRARIRERLSDPYDFQF